MSGHKPWPPPRNPALATLRARQPEALRRAEEYRREHGDPIEDLANILDTEPDQTENEVERNDMDIDGAKVQLPILDDALPSIERAIRQVVLATPNYPSCEHLVSLCRQFNETIRERGNP